MQPLLPYCRKAMPDVLVVLLIASSFCYGGSVEVTGAGECVDCQLKNIKAAKAFTGLHVTIDCKASNGETTTRGSGQLDKEGKFMVTLQEEIIQNGKLIEECYAKLHGASNAPCPAHDGLESSKFILVSKSNNEKHTLRTAGKIKFSSETCASAFFHWPVFKYPPPLPIHPWFKKPFPFPKPCPPLIPTPVPVIPKPLPPPVPVIPKPLPPPVPVIPKPLPPPKPKPCPEPFPPFPYHKPLPPFPYHKPLPPFPWHKPLPPFPYHKPWPPIPYHKPWPPIPMN